MTSFIAKRLLLGIIIIFGVILITFIMTRMIPSDPAAQWVGARATPEQIEQAREELGLSKPLYVQFGIYIKDLIRGNLGYSLRTHRPIMDELKSRVPATIELIAFSTVISILVGLPLGMLSAKKKNRVQDHLSRFFSIGFVSVPTFWLALILQLVFFKILGLLPMGGQLSMDIKLFHEIPDITGFLIIDSIITGDFVIFKNALIHLILPGIAIAAYPIGLITRMTRSALLEILNEDYIKAAKSYGLKDRLIYWHYALKNSLGPTVTVVTLSLGYTLMNTFLVESVFSWPGIGKYVAGAVTSLDYPAIMGITIFAAIAYIILNLMADIIIALDPRVRL